MATPLLVTVYRGNDRLLEEVFSRDLVKIGRLASAHIRLEDPAVGRIHAVLEASGAGYNLIDMGSPEGTRVNDQSISRVAIREGDVVAVGPFRIQLSSAPGVAAALRTPPPPPVESEDVVGAVAVPATAPDQPAFPATSPAASPASDIGAPQSGWTAAPQPTTGTAPPTSGGAVPLSQGGPAPVTAPEVVPATRVEVAPHAGTAVPPLSDPSGPASRPAAPSTGGPQSGGALPVGGGRAVGLTPRSAVRAEPTVAPRPLPEEAGASAWRTVPDNLASVRVPSAQRALEVRTVWKGDVVLDTLTVFDKPTVTLGDERKVKGWGPFQTIERCDVEIPSKGLPSASFVLAESTNPKAAEYRLNLPRGTTGHVERINGTYHDLNQVLRPAEGTEPGFVSYDLQAEETVMIELGEITLQVRYVRRTEVPPLPWSERISYDYLNTFILVLFLHVVSIASFLATPQTQRDLEEDVYRAVNRFAQIRLTAEQRRKQQQSMLAQLKAGERAEKAAGKEGKAGRKDAKPEARGRRAVKGKPNEKELAQAALQKLFGSGGEGAVASILGGGGLGGELESALGGVTGARVGDQRGLGGLGIRGGGPGGGGQSYTTAGTGPIGTKGRGGGGGGGYGDGAGSLGRKKDRNITIYTDKVTIRGSLPKEVIRRVIKQHLPQIRYCYEKELLRSPGIYGKVSTQFVISAAGTVSTAKVAQTTLKNRAVESCITQKIRTWRFPKPKGGGIVVVKYPFVLKQSG